MALKTPAPTAAGTNHPSQQAGHPVEHVKEAEVDPQANEDVAVRITNRGKFDVAVLLLSVNPDGTPREGLVTTLSTGESYDSNSGLGPLKIKSIIPPE